MEAENPKYLLQRIGERFEDYSPKQRVLAKYILDSYLDLAYATVSQLAQNAGVSETTVVRFVYSLGFGSFGDFMGELRGEIERDKQTRAAALNHRTLDRHTFEQRSIESPGDIMRAIFSMEMSVMEETLVKNSEALFDKAVEKLYGASSILIVGCEANKCHAQAAYFALDALKQRVRIIEEFSLYVRDQCESLPKNAVCVVISTPRYPRVTQSILMSLKESAGKPFIIGITDSVTSPITGFSDLVFQIPEKFVMFIDANAAYMSLIHALAFGVYLRNPGNAKKRIEKYDMFVKKFDFYVKDYLDLVDF